MPSYQFRYVVDDETVEDLAPAHHADLDAAHEWAVGWAQRLLAEAALASEPLDLPRCIEITDGHGTDLLYVVFWGGRLSGRPATVH
ncbi:MAG TPA: hypothetical protein VFO41_05090 [Alphaproteobacteria bacterium]|nr:hypothetical protein [Alphaproteobacteria bacterium]